MPGAEGPLAIQPMNGKNGINGRLIGLPKKVRPNVCNGPSRPPSDLSGSGRGGSGESGGN